MTTSQNATKPYFTASLPKNIKTGIFYYSARSQDYWVQTTFIEGSDSVSLNIYTEFNKYDHLGAEPILTVDLTRDEITKVLSFDDPQDLIDYALSLYNYVKSHNPCYVPSDNVTPCSRPPEANQSILTEGDELADGDTLYTDDSNDHIRLTVTKSYLRNLQSFFVDCLPILNEHDSDLHSQCHRWFSRVHKTLAFGCFTSSSAPLIPSDGDRASFIDDDLPPAYNKELDYWEDCVSCNSPFRPEYTFYASEQNDGLCRHCFEARAELGDI